MLLFILFSLYAIPSNGLQLTLQTNILPRKWVVPEKVPFGDISRLKLVEIGKNLPPPSPPPNNNNDKTIRIATRAVGLNFADVFTVLGYYTAANLVRTKELYPFCPGLEFSGIVMDDDSSSEFQQGDQVFGFSRFDSYADQVTASPEVLRKLPSTWTFQQGAAFLVNALTAWHGLVTVAGMPDVSTTDCDPQPHHPSVVLVHSATGGVGLYACEIAARRGALVIGIVGNEDKLPTFRDRIVPLCPEAQCIVRNPNKAQFAKDLLAATTKARSLRMGKDPPVPIQNTKDALAVDWGIDFVMESYGGKYFDASMDLINAGGSLATFGSTTYNGGTGGNRLAFLPLAWQYLRRPKVDPGDLTARNIRMGGFNLIFLTERTDQLAESLDQCIRCLEGGKGDGTLSTAQPPLVGKVFTFEEAPDALRALRSGETVGKVVLFNPKNPLPL